MSRRRAKGFTLVEVLVAVVILAIALGAIISGMGRYAGNAAHLKQKTIALWIAHNRLTELELEPAWPAEGKSDGEVEMAGGDWKWFVEVQKTPDDRLRRIDIRVQQVDSEADLASLTGFISQSGRQ